MFIKFLILIILSLSAFSKEIKDVNFTGEIDLVLGDFSKSNLQKVCNISYPPIYKIWQKNPTFTQYDILICSESIQEYAQNLGFYEANITYEIVEEKATLNIKKNRQIKISSIDVEDEYKNIIGLKIDSFFNASDFTNSKKKYL